MMENVIVCGLWPRGCCIYDPVQFYYWEKGGGRASPNMRETDGRHHSHIVHRKEKKYRSNPTVFTISEILARCCLLHRIAQRVNQKCDYESHMGGGYRGTEFQAV